jgi:hypothetical protein
MVSDTESGDVNAGGFLQPEGIRLSELVATGHVVHSGMLCRQQDYPISQAGPSAVGDFARRKLHLHFDNSRCQTARHVQEEMASHPGCRVSHPTYSPDSAIADFYLFGLLNQQLSRRALHHEQNVLETPLRF